MGVLSSVIPRKVKTYSLPESQASRYAAGMDDAQISRLLQDLVRIPSVNPHGDPGTKHVGEASMVAYLADFFRKLALDIETHEVEPGRANLIGKFTSRGSKRSVAFAPHTDTVSVAGMTIDPFGGEI